MSKKRWVFLAIGFSLFVVGARAINVQMQERKRKEEMFREMQERSNCNLARSAWDQGLRNDEIKEAIRTNCR